MLVLVKALTLLILFIPSLLWALDKANDIPKEKRYPDVGKLHMDEARLIYGQPTASERTYGGGNILRWSRTSDSTSMDDWIAKPYRRIPPGGHIDPTGSFTMALEFDRKGILAARRFEGKFPGFGDYEAMFRKP